MLVAMPAGVGPLTGSYGPAMCPTPATVNDGGLRTLSATPPGGTQQTEHERVYHPDGCLESEIDAKGVAIISGGGNRPPSVMAINHPDQRSINHRASQHQVLRLSAQATDAKDNVRVVYRDLGDKVVAVEEGIGGPFSNPGQISSVLTWRSMVIAATGSARRPTSA
ncbi:MAG: hypothetical protein ACYC8T_12850 [Myxococcaceae bacterium]